MCCSCEELKAGWRWKGPDGAGEDELRLSVLSESVRFGTQSPSQTTQLREYYVGNFLQKCWKSRKVKQRTQSNSEKLLLPTGLERSGRRWYQESRSQDHHRPRELTLLEAARRAETAEGLSCRSWKLRGDAARDAAPPPASGSHWLVEEENISSTLLGSVPGSLQI